MRNLKSCPFCGEKDFALASMVGGKGLTHYDIYQIKCNYCSSRGPSECTERKAKTAWNTRVKNEK